MDNDFDHTKGGGTFCGEQALMQQWMSIMMMWKALAKVEISLRLEKEISIWNGEQQQQQPQQQQASSLIFTLDSLLERMLKSQGV